MKSAHSLLALVSLLVAASAAAAPDAEEIVQKAEEVLRPDKSFSVVAAIDSFRNRAPEGSITLRTFVKVAAGPGTEPDAISVVSAPEAEAGKVILRQSGNLWLLAPGSRRPVKLSGNQRLQGDASLDDLVHLDLTGDYTATDEGEESITDASGKATKARRIVLSAKAKASTYPSLRLWTDRLFHRPVKLECLAASGKVLKTVFYDRYRGFLGSERPTELTIVDGTVPGRVTRVRFSDYNHRELPAELFTPDRMAEAAGLADQ